MLNRLAILGFGTMGQGIAQVSAMSGYQVKFFDINHQVMIRGYDNVIQQVEKSLDNEQKSKSIIQSVSSRLNMVSDMKEAVKDVDIIIEAITEDITAKKDLYLELSTIIKDSEVIIASNTSSFCISEFAEILKRPSHTVGMHFFNPVPKMKLVELITLPKTHPTVLQSLELFIKQGLSKDLIRCKDTPGFVVNRLLVPYLTDAINMAENSVASISDIDKAMKLGAGYPLGPFSLMDLIGIDVVKMITDNLATNDQRDYRLKASYLLDQMVKEGRLGRKVGRGFFSYKNPTN